MSEPVKPAVELICEPHYQARVLAMRFAQPVSFDSAGVVQSFREQWMKALSSWHSPYSALIDLTGVTVDPDNNEVKQALQRLLKLMQGFFLKKAIGFGTDPESLAAVFPFAVVTEEEARQQVGLERTRKGGAGGDFRATLHFQNHFKQHVMELSFSEPVVIDSIEKVEVLKSKLGNNLMQWHSKWSLLIDCANLDMTPEIHPEFQKVERFFKGFFLKEVLGYSPRGPKENYPFTVYRARHAAAGRLESEGNFSGDDANCKSRQ